MKKLMITLAVAAMAVASQAASVKWTGTLNGVSTSVDKDGTYSASSDALGATDTWKYVLTILSADGQTQIATKSGTSYGSSASVTLNNTSIQLNTDYTYNIVLTEVKQSSLRDKGDNYENAVLSATLSGELTTVKSGTTALKDIQPTTWTVSGIVDPEPTPEPTSAMLMLLGVAGLALKRKRA